MGNAHLVRRRTFGPPGEKELRSFSTALTIKYESGIGGLFAGFAAKARQTRDATAVIRRLCGTAAITRETVKKRKINLRTCTDRRGTPDGRGIFPSIKAL